MRRVLGWMTVVFLCCAAGKDAGVEPSDPRLVEAQAALDEAEKLQKEGKYAEAIPKAEQALTLREAVLGGTHPEVALCLHKLGALYRHQGEYARAEPLLQRALAIREAAFGKHHPLVAAALNSLASLYNSKGLYSQAEPLHQRALAIREEALGKDHPLVADSLLNLANLYANQGLFSRAEPLYQRALVIDEETYGKHHPNVAYTLNNLATVYNDQGLYSRAEPLLQRALAIREEALGKHHPDVAPTLNNLALLYGAQGLYSRAEPLHQRALAIREEALGEHHPDVASSLLNFATLYAEQGLYSRAEPLLQRALAIKEQALGKHHPSVAQSLNNLANLYREQGLYSRAEPLSQRALSIQEGAVGKYHPDFADSLENLALLYGTQGLHSRAEPLLQRALAIREEALGEHHPDVASSLNSLAQLRLAQHRLADALPLLTRAFSSSESRLRKESLDFSESRLTSFLQLLRKEEERLYALLRAHPRSASVQRLALTAVLLRKGRSVEEISNTSRTVFRSLGPQDRDTFERLRGLRTQLAQLSLQGPQALPPADYQKQLKELADQGDALEADLARHSAPLRALSALPSPDDIAGRVAASLPKDGALIEFVAYMDRPLVPKPGTPKSKLPSQLRYLALVLFPDAGIRILDLGPAAPIDRAVSRLRDALAFREAAYQPSAQALYTLVFKPLRPLLGGTRRLFLAPDGQLALAPFAALHDGKSFLVDSFDFSYLTSGKELLPRTLDTPSSGAVVVLADPAFTTPAPTSTTREFSRLQRSSSLERFFSTLRAEVAEHPWPPLPGTRLEAEAIQRLFPQAQLFLGADASKQRLLELPTPAVLHLATHGFFLEDAATPADSRALGAVGGPGVSARRPEDPLLRSGLVLTGARSQQPDATGTPTPRADSALVTALELAGLDLWGTQLVVLSACDTGRGDVKLGQGVYGLRRALVVAGAETLVMSLWKVNDDSTRLLMERYYQNLLAGQGRAAALQAAMLSLRQAQPHPHAWAPFISLGSDAPLRSLTTSPQRAPAP
ncbi:MAG: CHAT domain-containing protein [Myxococcaceae bacterium]|nr:CHAT domain-containing protein [Myxococcaceae bacterium]